MNERLKIFVNFLIVNLTIKNQADFAANIGIAKSQFSEVLSGKRKITENLVNKIHNSYPSLNKNWLSTGEGEMLTSVIQNNKNGDNQPAASAPGSHPAQHPSDRLWRIGGSAGWE